MRPAALFVFAACILSVAAAAGEGISVSEEIIVFADGPGKLARATPDVAFGKGVYLVVWREGWDGKGGGARVYAARVAADGKILDEKGIQVAPSEKGVQTYPQVASDGKNFLVVWEDFRNGKDHDILAARVSPEGKVLDTKPIAVAVGPRSQVLPDVASDGKNFLVVWQGMRAKDAGYHGFAAPISADGKAGTAVETGALPQPRVASDGEKYLVVYGSSSTSGFLLGPDGKPAGSSLTAVGRSKGACFSIAGAPGKGWLVVGHRSPPDPWGWGGPGAMRCGAVKPDGKVDNPTLKEPSGNWGKLKNWLDVGGRKRTTWPWGESTIAWDGKHFVAVWQRHHIAGEKKSSFKNCELIASRVDGWKPLDDAGVPVAATEREEKYPALASDRAGKLLCVYEKYCADGQVRICARRLSTR